MLRLKFHSGAKKGGRDLCVVSISDKDESLVWNRGTLKMIIGITDKKNAFDRKKIILLARKIIRLAQKYKITKLSLSFNDFKNLNKNIESNELAYILGTHFELANFNFHKFKSNTKEKIKVKELNIYGNIDNKLKKSFKRGLILADEINKSRDLANTPGGDMTPEILAEKAKEAAEGTNVKVTVLKKKKIEELGMGALLGVARGSAYEPRFIIMEYRGGEEAEKPIVLVGKGVTFDTGGLNLKPSENILDMHMDMSGGAAVIHTIIALAKLKVEKNVVALIPAVENMVSGESYRPGDILRSMSGKTIEVLNTDAEGRLILADALHYAKNYNPELVIDVATLTGASIVALGQFTSAILSNDENLLWKFKELGEKVDDRVWPLPLWEEYEALMKGTFADIANISKTKYGGAITAAAFLHQFIKGTPWVHIDIAPRMVATETEFLAKGSVGAPIRLLVEYIRQLG